MLFEKWSEVADAFPDQVALRDLAAGGHWTFHQLANAAENGPRENVVFPQGGSPEFIISLLRAWRFGQVVCPLESGQVQPNLARELPAGIAHLKTTSATTGSSS